MVDDVVGSVVKKGSGTLEGSTGRNIVDTKGVRNDLPLTPEQYDELASYAKSLDFQKKILPHIIWKALLKQVWPMAIGSI